MGTKWVEFFVKIEAPCPACTGRGWQGLFTCEECGAHVADPVLHNHPGKLRDDRQACDACDGTGRAERWIGLETLASWLDSARAK